MPLAAAGVAPEILVFGIPRLCSNSLSSNDGRYSKENGGLLYLFQTCRRIGEKSDEGMTLMQRSKRVTRAKATGERRVSTQKAHSISSPVERPKTCGPDRRESLPDPVNTLPIRGVGSLAAGAHGAF